MPNVVVVRKLLGESRCSVSNAVSHQKGEQGSEGCPIALMNKDRNARWTTAITNEVIAAVA